MLSHERTGSGPPLLLLHGIGMRWQWWAPCLPGLAARFDVAAVDFPGFGASPPLSGTPTPEALADAVSAFARELGWERPHVAGISMGGLVALELARRDAVASACAISPAGFTEGWERTLLDVSLRGSFRLSRALAGRAEAITGSTAGRTALFSQVCARPWRIPAAEAAGHLRAVATSDYTRARGPVVAARFLAPEGTPAPVTVAWGTRDRLLLPPEARRIETRMSAARLLHLGGCGHIPTYDDPAQTVGLLEGAAALGG